MISLEQGVELVWHAFEDMVGGEIYVKKIPSMKILDIAKAILPNSRPKIIGIRPGEKLHEQMISEEDARTTFEYSEYYKIIPNLYDWHKAPNRIKNGVKIKEGFSYSSDNNENWMSVADLQNWLKAQSKNEM